MFKGTDVTLKEWVIAGLLLIIPIVNILLIFIFAFGSDFNKSFSNFFKAQLLMGAVAFVFMMMILFSIPNGVI